MPTVDITIHKAPLAGRLTRDAIERLQRTAEHVYLEVDRLEAISDFDLHCELIKRLQDVTERIAKIERVAAGEPVADSQS